MSGIAKGVKKVFKAVTKIPKTIGSAINKVHKKLRQSKIYKIAVTAAAVYFGGAALMGMASGSGAAAGLSSAWGGLQGAGSALMAGNFSGAASAIGSGFMGTYGTAAATAGTALAGTGGAITAGGVTAATPAAQAGLASFGASTAAPTVASAATTAGTTAASSGGLLSGLWSGLGEAGKAAVVTGGVNMAGQMIQGHAAEKAAEEERERRTYWGVDGAGRTAQNQPEVGNLNYATPYPNQPAGYTQPPKWQPKTLDDLINETRNRTNANSGLLWG